ncbi:uncharacterized [Tachysurus ichikawai]
MLLPRCTYASEGDQMADMLMRDVCGEMQQACLAVCVDSVPLRRPPGQPSSSLTLWEMSPMFIRPALMHRLELHENDPCPFLRDQHMIVCGRQCYA